VGLGLRDGTAFRRGARGNADLRAR
jgi:hypothetical protein